uniref:Alanine--tRNA ligase n=1 Tax=candidate division WOR-3 bacterium TaxID=2052148 RepID=A0A7C4TCD9_UNCW3
MNSEEVRKSFLGFFKERGHTIVPSMSLIPKDDPSLLFTSAGMVQFKPFWTGSVPLPYRRAASIQKCLRLSDLENVGRTRRHHTFFEMLGNFSFGDYFKEEAILWAWEFLVGVLKIDKGKLFVSVHKDDDETYEIWHKKVGLSEHRIFKLGDDTNFWGPAGNSGPCGPCSEIYYDLGEKFSCGKKTCAPGCDCDRYSEIWNLVFPQFDQKVSGERLPLKNRGVDTGMGLERLISILQDKTSNFHTDLFYPIIQEITGMANVWYGENQNTDVSINVIADHIRALTFAIGDGIIPSNEERGYVLRRLLRRAVRLARNLGIRGPALYKFVPRVVDLYKSTYPELVERREEITLVIKSEEERFLNTLEKGLALFEEIAMKKKKITGEDAFKLYDTYGFPLELTVEIAKEKNIRVDEEGFKNYLEQAREVSRAKAKFTPKGEWKVLKEGKGEFVGYERDEIETEILRYNEYDKNVEIVLEKSPFYAESGGQVGEKGEIVGREFVLEVLDTYWFQGMNTCHCKVKKGKFKPEKVIARVDITKRKESARAHTATHLLHSALRKILGEHARQEGSFVEPGRFRFDFIHFKPLSEDQIRAIEDLVNKKILEAIKVEKFWTSLEEAKRLGAMALFGEKYGEKVRVVKIGDFSIELCGGIHLENTGEVGLFKITGEESTAAGMRRIEAVVGLRFLEEMRNQKRIIRSLSELLGVDTNLINRVEELQKEVKRLEEINRKNQIKIARIEAEEIIREITAKKMKFVIRRFDDFGIEGMRLIADIVREKTSHLLGFFYEVVKNKVNYLVFTTKDLEKELPANAMIKIVSKIIGGGGGGKSHLAEGGGGSLEKISELEEFFKKKFS